MSTFWDVVGPASYADRVSETERQQDPEVAWYMGQYPDWYNKFTGRFLEQEAEGTKDPKSNQKSYKFPVRYNLCRSYSMTHAGALWGTPRVGNESGSLFNMSINPKVPGLKEHVEAAPLLQEALDYFWDMNSHHLRAAGATQQWAGGCILKASWQPWSDTSVFGTILEQVDPRSYWPVANPTNPSDIIAVKIAFEVPRLVAQERYNVTAAMLGTDHGSGDTVTVTEYWDRHQYSILLGSGKNRVIGRYLIYNPDTKTRTYEPMQGDNPWIHPLRGTGIIPIHYIPRVLTTGMFGDSLVYELSGLMLEVNKNLADFGDALADGSHFKGAVVDYTGGQKRIGFGRTQQKKIEIPKSGLLDLGETPQGSKFQARIYPFPAAEVPSTGPAFMGILESLADQVAHVSPAARGAGDAQSGFQASMQMLPTTQLVDWARAHWSHGLAGPNGLNVSLATMWFHKSATNVHVVIPKIPQAALRCRQSMKYRNVVPRDRMQEVQDVTNLVANKIISPGEALKRLGDSDDLKAVIGDTYWFIQFIAAIEAIVAGRPLNIGPVSEENPERPALPEPAIGGGGETAVKQPSTQPQPQKKE